MTDVRRKTQLVYNNMRRRCENPACESYARYGGRGISVSPSWATFESFLADMGVQPEGMTLDRIDNDGNYEPGNCRWVSPKENARNTRRNHFIEFKGERRCLSDWAEKTGIHKTTLLLRLKRGWSVENALTIPAQRSVAA